MDCFLCGIILVGDNNMKKIIIVIICLVLLTGCGKKEEIKEPEKEEFILEKIDKDKEIVYLEDVGKVKYGNNKEYEIKNIIINIKGENIDNINLELKNFVLNNYNNMKIDKDVMKYGNIIDYEYYVTDKIVTVIQNYSFYINGKKEESDSNIYVISLDTGKLMNNKEILEKYDYDEDKMYEYLENNIDSEDISFTMMQIKNDGYKLYIDDKDKLIVRYMETLNDGSIEKELILN